MARRHFQRQHTGSLIRLAVNDFPGPIRDVICIPRVNADFGPIIFVRIENRQFDGKMIRLRLLDRRRGGAGGTRQSSTLLCRMTYALPSAQTNHDMALDGNRTAVC